MGIWFKRLGLVLFFAAMGGAIYLALREQPIQVDIAQAKIKPMRVTINEEGVARVRDIYTISSPISGHLDRTTLDEGEAVIANKTIIASIHPLDPPFLDERTEAELKAAVEAAKSAIMSAKAEHTHVQMAMEQAQSDYRRALELSKTNVISESKLEQTYSALKLHEALLESREAFIRLRQAELVSAQARLRQPSDNSTPNPSDTECCMHLVSPIDGVVLKVLARSEQAVAPGVPITEVGDPRNLEIAVDLLSSDAPKLRNGAKVEISDWGGENTLTARIRRIDPAAVTKISSLGIEEQRVDVILDLETVPEQLGHGYRVLAKLEIWSGDTVLQVPIGALFRANGSWAVFVLQDGRAVMRTLTIDHMSDQSAEVLDGLSENEKVVLYPNDLLEDGSLIQPR